MGLDGEIDLSGLKPIVGLPPDRTLPHLNDLDIDVELHSSRAGSIEMLVKPEPGARLDLAPLDQIHPLHVLTPQRIVACV